jgi:thioredoxin 1
MKTHLVEEHNKQISEEKFQKIISSNELVVVDCFATWCGPCIGFKPVFEELSNTYPNVKFVSIDTDETRWIGQKYDIDSIPRFLFFKNSQLVYEHKGASARQVFEYFIQTKLLGKQIVEELIEGLQESEFNDLVKTNEKLVIEFHPYEHEESEQLKPFYAPLIEKYKETKFLFVQSDNKNTKWAMKAFQIGEDFPHFVMIKNGEIVADKHIHHPEAVKYAIDEKLYGITPFTHDSFMSEEKFDSLVRAYKHFILFIMKEGNRSSDIMRNYLFQIAEKYPDLPLIALKLKENPWLVEKYSLEDGEFTRYGEDGKKCPYFVFYKNQKIVHESGPIVPGQFEDIIQGKLLKLFAVDEYEHGISEPDFDKILEHPKVIVDVFTSWCTPCTEMRPIFRDLSRKHDNIKFISIDLDYSRWMGDKFEVTSIPSFLFFKNGQLIKKHVGFLEEENFRKQIQEHLN